MSSRVLLCCCCSVLINMLLLLPNGANGDDKQCYEWQWRRKETEVDRIGLEGCAETDWCYWFRILRKGAGADDELLILYIQQDYGGCYQKVINS